MNCWVYLEKCTKSAAVEQNLLKEVEVYLIRIKYFIRAPTKLILVLNFGGSGGAHWCQHINHFGVNPRNLIGSTVITRTCLIPFSYDKLILLPLTWDLFRPLGRDRWPNGPTCNARSRIYLSFILCCKRREFSLSPYTSDVGFSICLR